MMASPCEVALMMRWVTEPGRRMAWLERGEA